MPPVPVNVLGVALSRTRTRLTAQPDRCEIVSTLPERLESHRRSARTFNVAGLVASPPSTRMRTSRSTRR